MFPQKIGVHFSVDFHLPNRYRRPTEREIITE